MINAMNVFLVFGGVILVAIIAAYLTRRPKDPNDYVDFGKGFLPASGPPEDFRPGEVLRYVTIDDVIAHYDAKMKELGDRFAYDLNVALETEMIVDLDIECYVDITAHHTTRRIDRVLHVGSGIQSKVRR